MIITNKYHVAYAGKGVKYSWGYSKLLYPQHPLAVKKGRDNDIALVNKCLSGNMITKNMMRKFSKRARGYLAAYKASESDETKENDEPTEISHQMIEK